MISKVSLIPYLEPGDGKFHLNIVSPHPTDDGEEYSRYPFQILSDAEPFSRLFKAQLVSGGRQSFSSLFLLVQRDIYRHKPDEIWPLGNPDLDHYWQHTFSYISTKDNLQNRFFPLKDTTSPEGKLVPFQSLFYCSFKERFFHPPCPTCGKLLELCENDELLSSKGLMAYSTTLKRYLFCPSCPQDNTDVYTHNREDTDPLIVRDLHELVRSWRSIVTGRIESQIFPCTDCPEQNACFGKTDLSNTRIIPFTFYPSYILAFEASSMSAIDFLPLISGAAMDEIIPPLKENKQYGRLSCLLEWQQIHGRGDLFLFSGKAEQFLEILYLKLSFLSDVARIILSPGAVPIPLDISTAIDSLWVNLSNHNSLLPGFWNFKINLFTVGSRGTDADSLPPSHPSQTCYCLGIIWFFALLRNKAQSVQIMKEALKQILKHPAESILASELPELAPENVFWNPDARRPDDISREWRILWEHTVSLGKHLLQGKYTEKADNSENKFFTDLEKIRQEIKQLLFYSEKETVTNFSKQTADAEIHRILSHILEQRQSNTDPPSPPLQSKEETLTETVILSINASTGLPKGVETTAETSMPSRSTEEELQETVILKTNAAPSIISETIPSTHPPGATTATDEKDDMPETLILKPSYTKDKH